MLARLVGQPLTNCLEVVGLGLLDLEREVLRLRPLRLEGTEEERRLTVALH